MVKIASYYPSTKKIFAIYDSEAEAKEDVKLLNCFSSANGEKLQVGQVKMTEDEYNEFQKETSEFRQAVDNVLGKEQPMVAIKDFEMPKSCAECPCFDGEHDGICRVLGYTDLDAEVFQERSTKCPLTEVEDGKLGSSI